LIDSPILTVAWVHVQKTRKVYEGVSKRRHRTTTCAQNAERNRRRPKEGEGLKIRKKTPTRHSGGYEIGTDEDGVSIFGWEGGRAPISIVGGICIKTHSIICRDCDGHKSKTSSTAVVEAEQRKKFGRASQNY